ncbi:Calx-beta domain-containing protein [Kribbella sp. VKM Ac-2569]|uniref:Calx-beta domain-containing protein n=1 Tax=Kribbella sp. VKM Ac-2569 TaxID=2512220 RepID=UPI001F543632|nr:Calx-beta domain-containing protein [Kribbella sp. VKM Ac-2569]
MIGRTARNLSLGIAVLLGVGPLTATASPPVVAQSNQWDVQPVASGYQLTLHLDAPAPMRASLPLLEVDGTPLGVAKQSPDRRTLTLISTDPAVLKARDVRLVWSGDLGKEAGKSRSVGSAGPTDADWLKARRGPLLPSDPGALGKYKVDTAEYNLGDEAVNLPGLAHRSELRGKVYSPRGAVGPRPLVVFLHGRHEVCYGEPTHPSDNEKPWPCPPGMKPIPSYRGYDGPATALASNGYQVVSISANAINGWDSDAYDAGAQARAELILDHLALWRKWSTIGGGPFGTRFVGKVNLQNVGLMGHSRGGEGVARAAVLNADRGGQYGIRAVLPLAPTDFARVTVPGVAMSVVLPYCDGDVSDLQGQKFYDDTRYSVGGDTAPRSTVTVLGANHNFFNTEWTPGQSVAPSNDDWFGDEKASPCGAKYAGRLTAKQQQAVGTAYVAGFFRLQLGHETQFLAQFDGSDSRAASAGKAVVRVVSQAPLGSRRDLNHFDKALSTGAVTGKLSATVCAGVAAPTRRTGTPTCMETEDWGNAPHWGTAWFAARTPTTAVTKLRWTGTNGIVRVDVPAGKRDVRRFAALTFRAAPDPAGAPKTDLSVRVVDGHGRAAAVPVSAVSDALVRMPGNNEVGLPKNLLRTVRIAVSSLKGVNLRDVRAVELRTDRVASGSAYVSDLGFSSPGLGLSAPAVLLPKLSASSVTVKEGDKGTHTVDFWVRMSRPSIRPVSVYVETNGDLGESVGDVARHLVFKPGQVRQKVTVPITANTRDSYDLPFSLVLSAPHDGLLNESFGHGLVVDDDPTPTLTLGNLKATEKAGVVSFPVKLSAPSDKYISFSGVLKDGTAVIRKDYRSVSDDGTGTADRTVEGSVEPGKTTGELQVKILDDKVKEPTETFTAVINQIDGATLKIPTTLTATITDND